MLEPIFEADLQPEQYAYRADRSALDAVRQVHKLLNTGHEQIVDAAFDQDVAGSSVEETDEKGNKIKIRAIG